MTVDLYTPAEVKIVRLDLLQEQNNCDALTGLPLASSDAVLDHDHKTQLVRGVLHRQTNVVLGKIENAYLRYLKFWYPHSLPEFLRKAADYLELNENEPDSRWHHPGWIKSIKTLFNKLTSKQKDAFLQVEAPKESKDATNDTKRKALFSKLLLTRKNTYLRLQTMLMVAIAGFPKKG